MVASGDVPGPALSLPPHPAAPAALRHCLCSTTFGVDFSMIPLGGMSRAHEAGGVAPFLVPDESRSVAAADVFVDGEMEARK